MGWRASDTRELLLDNAEVPAENRLGAEGEGFINFMKTLDAGRIGVAALSLGLAQGAFDPCELPARVLYQRWGTVQGGRRAQLLEPPRHDGQRRRAKGGAIRLEAMGGTPQVNGVAACAGGVDRGQ